MSSDRSGTAPRETRASYNVSRAKVQKIWDVQTDIPGHVDIQRGDRVVQMTDGRVYLRRTVELPVLTPEMLNALAPTTASQLRVEALELEVGILETIGMTVIGSWRRLEPGASSAGRLKDRVYSAIESFQRGDEAVVSEAFELFDWCTEVDLSGIPSDDQDTILSLLHEATDAYLQVPADRKKGKLALAILLGFLVGRAVEETHSRSLGA